ncbi:uncharacterized protein LOC143635973 [Bidens hawaiensis]|uniref:uncharacterized protein LOC143635973 n=1 Tax=Bidens hawaiensis TaxID=980011 RepID=UPI00404A2A2F
MAKPLDGNREGENWCFSWLSHWMFGQNEMKPGDEITIHVEHLFPTYDDDVIKECGIDLVYYENGKTEEEEDALGYYKSWNHIIGGDLSDLQLTTGEYFLEQTQFTRDPKDSYYSLSTGPRNYKVEKVLFKAFSQKSSEILGSQAECSETRPTAMSPDGVPYMSISLQPDFGHQKQLSPGGYTVKQLNDHAGEAIAFANSSPEKQRTILSEKLYPIVKFLEAESATEVTEMLLELGPAEVLHLLGSPQELKAKVAQAMGILRSSSHIRSVRVVFALSHANSGTEEKAILGRNLYPLVEELESESAPEVTTMLLELDLTEVRHLLESPEALKAKVAEAMDCLQSSDHHLLLACAIFALANANSGTKQRTILCDYLYPLVEQLEAESAQVVTRMLVDQLELHQNFIMLLSQEALQEKVAEAMEVLRSVNPSGDAIVTSALANASPTE